MTRPPRVLAQRILDFGLHGGGRQFLLPDESGFLISDGMGSPSATAASIHVRRLNPETLAETGRVRTADVPHDFALRDGGRSVLCCTWRQVFVLESGSLAIQVRAKLGEGLGCLDLDLDEDHLVVGAMGSLQLLRASTLEPITRKRIGRVTAIARAPNGHTVVLLIGTEGRIIWFDCDRAKAVSELSVPHFSHAISDGSRVFLQLGQLTKYEPRAIGAGGEKVYVPPIDLVEPGGGVGVVDLARRSLVAEYEMPRSTIKPWPLQLSSSRERLFVLAATGSSRLIRSIRLANGEVEFDWQLPETAIPLAALREGERAIIADERMNWQRILLVERD